MIHKPYGVLHPRVQQVGPERFGVVSVDCAKACSKWMLCNFYGQVLLPPTELSHTQGHFAAAVALLREALAEHGLRDFSAAKLSSVTPALGGPHLRGTMRTVKATTCF
jgi:hypothetical protein